MKRPRGRLNPPRFWAFYALLFAAATAIAFVVASEVKFPETKSMLQVFAIQAPRFHEVCGRWPSALDEFARNPRGITFVYSKAMLKSDSWGNPWAFEQFDPARGYGIVRSLGRDGKPGGSGLDQDIESRFPGSPSPGR